VMMTFDDFVIGMEQFGTRILPQMRCRNPVHNTDEVAWRLMPRECFGNLLRDPFRCRVHGHVDPDKLSPRQPDNDQDVEQVEADGREDCDGSLIC
jgi:hypothetical protein